MNYDRTRFESNGTTALAQLRAVWAQMCVVFAELSALREGVMKEIRQEARNRGAGCEPNQQTTQAIPVHPDEMPAAPEGSGSASGAPTYAAAGRESER